MCCLLILPSLGPHIPNPSDHQQLLRAAQTEVQQTLIKPLSHERPVSSASHLPNEGRHQFRPPEISPSPGCLYPNSHQMGSSDVAPPHVPGWVVPLSTVALGLGVLFWDATYILMTLRSLRTKSYPMPILGLAINVSWEIVYACYVSEALFEKAGFAFWLILDIGLIYTTVKFAPHEWERTSSWVGRHMAAILAVMTAVGCLGHFAFVSWWLSRPGIGHGDKSGKWYFGRDQYDTTELAYWSAGVAQMIDSVGSLAMLLVRGHSGGTSYGIW